MKKARICFIISAALFFSAASFSGCSHHISSAEPFLTFRSDAEFSIKTANEKPNWDGTLEYSTNKETWTEWNGELITSGTDNAIYFRGTGNTVITGEDGYEKGLVITPETGKTVSCTGNIENLLDYVTVKAGEHPVMAEDCYAEMFYGCTGLRFAPELPAITLSDWCYYGMFYGCTGLSEAPELPASTLAEGCYDGMFYGCTGLSEAPVLPASTLADCCYLGMFNGCTGLTAAPELPANTLAADCYADMFSGCTGLSEAPVLPATSLAKGCYLGMFSGCTGLRFAPKLPATTLAVLCYYAMFEGCTGLKIKNNNDDGKGTLFLSMPATFPPYAVDGMFSYTVGTYKSDPVASGKYYYY